MNNSAVFNIEVFRKDFAESDEVGVFTFESGIVPGVEKRVHS
jgi:hypothetical protein